MLFQNLLNLGLGQVLLLAHFLQGLYLHFLCHEQHIFIDLCVELKGLQLLLLDLLDSLLQAQESLQLLDLELVECLYLVRFFHMIVKNRPQILNPARLAVDEINLFVGKF